MLIVFYTMLQPCNRPKYPTWHDLKPDANDMHQHREVLAIPPICFHKMLCLCPPSADRLLKQVASLHKQSLLVTVTLLLLFSNVLALIQLHTISALSKRINDQARSNFLWHLVSAINKTLFSPSKAKQPEHYSIITNSLTSSCLPLCGRARLAFGTKGREGQILGCNVLMCLIRFPVLLLLMLIILEHVLHLPFLGHPDTLVKKDHTSNGLLYLFSRRSLKI